MKKSVQALSCDWKARNRAVPAKPLKEGKSGRSIICRHKGNFKWEYIKTEAYKLKDGDWSKIIRRVLVGDRLKAKSHVRYFEIARRGQSSFEKHRHEHIVIGIRGRGKVLLNRKSNKIGFLDIVYVSPNTAHQFSNPFKEPFGFLCIVSAKRDKPVLLNR